MLCNPRYQYPILSYPILYYPMLSYPILQHRANAHSGKFQQHLVNVIHVFIYLFMSSKRSTVLRHRKGNITALHTAFHLHQNWHRIRIGKTLAQVSNALPETQMFMCCSVWVRNISTLNILRYGTFGESFWLCYALLNCYFVNMMLY